MAATEMNTEIRSDVEPERVGLVWMDAEQAMIARWRGEPTVERLASDVPPKRQAMGSVRRGPARPSGGGRVPGHGTEGRHRDLLRRYFADLVGRVADLDVIEVTGRGLPYRQFAELFRQLASRRNADVEVRTRRMSPAHGAPAGSSAAGDGRRAAPPSDRRIEPVDRGAGHDRVGPTHGPFQQRAWQPETASPPGTTRDRTRGRDHAR